MSADSCESAAMNIAFDMQREIRGPAQTPGPDGAADGLHDFLEWRNSGLISQTPCRAGLAVGRPGARAKSCRHWREHDI